MKVLFLADVPLFEPTSGAEQVLYQEANGLGADGMDVCAITRGTSGNRVVTIQHGRVREFRYGADPGRVLPFFLTLFRRPPALFDRIGSERPFNVVICHQPYTAFSLLIRGRVTGLPMIYAFFSPSHEEYLLSLGSSVGPIHRFQASARRCLEGFVIRKADRVVVLSEYTKELVVRYHGVPPDRIATIPGGADVLRFRVPGEPRNRLKQELGLPEGRVHLLTVRNLEERMGVDALIEAVHRLNRYRAAYHLTIGGSGPKKDDLLQLVRRLGLDDQVSLVGFIPSEDLPRYYGAADYFILPTAHLEGFGLVTPEAMACGTPVLGTPVGGTIEILSRFDPDHLFSGITARQMADGIERIVSRHQTYPEAYRRLRERCRTYIDPLFMGRPCVRPPGSDRRL